MDKIKIIQWGFTITVLVIVFIYTVFQLRKLLMIEKIFKFVTKIIQNG